MKYTRSYFLFRQMSEEYNQLRRDLDQLGYFEECSSTSYHLVNRLINDIKLFHHDFEHHESQQLDNLIRDNELLRKEQYKLQDEVFSKSCN